MYTCLCFAFGFFVGMLVWNVFVAVYGTPQIPFILYDLGLVFGIFEVFPFQDWDIWYPLFLDF